MYGVVHLFCTAYAPEGGGLGQDPIRFSYLRNVKKVRTGGRGGQILPKNAYIINERPLSWMINAQMTALHPKFQMSEQSAKVHSIFQSAGSY